MGFFYLLPMQGNTKTGTGKSANGTQLAYARRINKSIINRPV